MVKFRFEVHCSRVYENAHYAETKEEAIQCINYWNEEYKKAGNTAYVKLLSIEEVTDEEFLEDYIPCY